MRLVPKQRAAADEYLDSSWRHYAKDVARASGIEIDEALQRTRKQLDHILPAGHLDPGAHTHLAVRVFRHVLSEIDPSPLVDHAKQILANVRHVFRLLVRARRMGASEVTKEFGEVFSSHWKIAEESMHETAELYNGWYAAAVTNRDSE